MLVKARVFGGENRVLHVLGHVLQAHEVAALFAEFAEELAVRAPDAQRHLRAVVGQHVERRQLPVDEGEDEDGKKDARSETGRADGGGPLQEGLQSGRLPASGGRAFFAGDRHGLFSELRIRMDARRGDPSGSWFGEAAGAAIAGMRREGKF